MESTQGAPSKKDESSITLSKDMLYGIAIAVLACLLVVSVFTAGFGLVHAAAPQCNATQCQACNSSAANGSEAAASAKTMQLPASMQLIPLMGAADSKVSLLEFSDFQCPFCGLAWGKAYAAQYAAITGTVKKFETDYVQTGKASFRFAPVAFLGDGTANDESVNSANAAMCAADQGLFFEMHDAIFNAQDTSENNGKYSIANLKTLAAGVSGLETAKFNTCLDGGTNVGLIDTFTTEWGTVSRANSGGAGTPTFYVLVDASKASEAAVSAAASAAGFDWGLTEDKKTYVIIASPEYAKIQEIMSALG